MTSSGNSARAERRLRRTIRDDFAAFSRLALKSHGFAPARHHLAIIERLERVARGDTTRLMLLLPPGSAKSTYASLLFPAWWFARHPASSVIAVAHTRTLAEHFGRGVRDLMQLHGTRLGVALRGDTRAAGRFGTRGGGEYFAAGVRGAVTGRRADLALIDDPIRSAEDAENRAARDRLWQWFRADLVTRLKPGGRVVLATARWHVDDLAGRLLESGGWDVLCLPALAEGDDPLGRAAGAPLWPEWEDAAALDEKRQLIGERGFAALFQQRPLAEAGQLFDVRKLRIVDVVPPGVSVRGWDLAATDGDVGNPDWTAGVRLLRDDSGAYFVEDVVRLRGDPIAVEALLRATAEADGYPVRISLPRDPGQAGKSQISSLVRRLAGFRVSSTPETESKSFRAGGVAAQVSNGTVSLRRAAWNSAFIEEIAAFPHGAKDDQVDALSRAFAMLTDTGPRARFLSLPHLAR